MASTKTKTAPASTPTPAADAPANASTQESLTGSTNATNVGAQESGDTNGDSSTGTSTGTSSASSRKGLPRGPQLAWTNDMRRDLVGVMISTEPPLTARKIHDVLVTYPSFAVAVSSGLLSPKKVTAQVNFLRERWPEEEKVEGECPLPELEHDGREEVEWGSLAALLK